MSPYPEDPVRAVGPMRLVVTTYPSPTAADEAVRSALTRHLAACANVIPIRSQYWWKGELESAEESLVLFKTVPKRVGALLSFLDLTHPYDTPEVIELDVPRVNSRYLQYLIGTLDPSPPPSLGARSRRRAAQRARAARAPGRTRVPHRRRSRRTGS
jgi:periplasmic divalent cation tolerance protein